MIINPVHILHHDILQVGLSVLLVAPGWLGLSQVKSEVPDVQRDVVVITGKNIIVDEGREVGETGTVQIPGEGFLFLEHRAGRFSLVSFHVVQRPAEWSDGAGPGGRGQGAGGRRVVQLGALQPGVHVERVGVRVRGGRVVDTARAVGNLGWGGQVTDTARGGRRSQEGLETLLIVIQQGQLGAAIQSDGC